MKDLKILTDKNNINLFANITTNGSLLNYNTVLELINLGITLFQITIDGKKSNHDKQRILKNGTETYDLILKNIENLLKINQKFKIVLRTNFSKEMLNNSEDYYSSVSYLFKDERVSAFFHTIVNYDNMEHLVTDMDILNEMKIALKYNFRFPKITEYLNYITCICYAEQENNYIINQDLKLSRCTVCQDDFSYIGELDKNGNINKYPSFKLWNNLETSNSCLSCSDYEICAGGFCPLYQIKKGFSRCMKFKEDFKKLELLKFADLQKAYNLYIHK